MSVLTEMEQAFIACRTFGHQWDTFNPLETKRGYGTHISLRCERCTMERHDWINNTGELNQRSYKVPGGYATKKDDRPHLQDLRLEFIARIKKAQRRNSGNG